MDEDSGLSYKDLATQEKINAFIQDQKEVIKLCKKYNNEPGGANGYRIEFNPETKGYSVYFAQTDILISTQDEKGEFKIREKGLTEYAEFMKRLEETGEDRLITLRPDQEKLPTEEEYREYGERTRQRNTQGTPIKDEVEKQPEEEQPKVQESQEGRHKQDTIITKSAIKLPLDKKVDERGRSLEEIFRTKYPELFKGNVELYLQADENNVDYFRLYVVGEDGTQEVPVKRTTGEHALNVNALAMPKDGENIQDEQLEQVLELDNDTAIGVNFDGKNHTTIYYGTRTKDNDWKFQHLVERNKEGERQDASYEVRNSTGGSTYERDFGANERQGFNTLEDLPVPTEINPAQDGNGISINEIGNTSDLSKVQENFCKDVEEKYKLPPEVAKYVTEEVFNNARNFDEVIQKVQTELDKQKQNEEKGIIMPGSAVFATLGILRAKNKELETDEKIPEPRRGF